MVAELWLSDMPDLCSPIDYGHIRVSALKGNPRSSGGCLDIGDFPVNFSLVYFANRGHS